MLDSINILEFRTINLNDINDKKFLKYKINGEEHDDIWAWSRVYEYPLVINLIKKYYNDDKNILIHNTSWGYDGIHVTFKEILDIEYPKTIHSDIRESDLSKTFLYDITKEPTEDLINKFDVVLNISTVEEVDYYHLDVINNLLLQVKEGGLLIITFDIPGFQVREFEEKFNINIQTTENDISGINSVIINEVLSHLNCGFLVIKK